MKKEFLYGICGLALGVVAALLFATIMFPRSENLRQQVVKKDTHVMPDGTQMSNTHSGMTMEDMINELFGKSGDEFDKVFLSGMIEHHEGAIDMAELVFENAKHTELKDMAQDIIEAQTSEIEMMKKWQKEWGYIK